jgi:carbon-monoxide dehydrogenase large subunit
VTLGEPVRRLEDDRLLRGAGRFADDVDRAGQRFLRVVRSSAAHARITGIETWAAMAIPGVHAVLTAADLSADLGQVPVIPMRIPPADRDLTEFLQPVLAGDEVRYVGEPVAAVLADDPYLAEDAAELVAVDYEELEPVLDAAGHEATRIEVGYGDTEAAFAGAAHVVQADVRIGRHTAVPMEPRALVAEWANGRLTLWGATKVPHFNLRLLAGMLGLARHDLHFTQTDAGGGFGVRGELYPEDFLVAYLAKATGRPVKWTEDRSEHLVAVNHSRQQRHRISAAFDEEGRILALRDEAEHDNGAYLRTHGVAVPDLTVTMLPGPYRVPAYAASISVGLTNKTPCGTYRGPGRYEGTFARERLLDTAAAQLGIDPVELRRRNLLTPGELPLERDLSTLDTAIVLDGGDYAGLLDRTLAEAGWDGWVAEAERAREQGRRVGNGAVVFLEKSGLGPYETAAVEVDETGVVRIASGAASVGQGVETVLAQVVAGPLGVEPHQVRVVLSDTDLVPDGMGSWASRSTVVAGSAALQAAEATAEQARRVAGELLEADPEDLVLEGGRVVVKGSEKGVPLAEVAAACAALPAAKRGEQPGLGAKRVFTVDHMTYPYGVHLAQVEIDPETGGPRVLRYFIGYEVGRAVNPMMVEGQLVGGAAQGLAGALLEEFRYDDAGQPLATTFIDYLMPTAAELPHVGTLVRQDAPAPDNPLGVRGAGEGGTSACGAAVASALDDALGRPGAVTILPATPERLRALLADGGL